MMVVRITRGKIKPGTWDAFEKAYGEACAAAGPVAGLISRSLSRNLADPDEGYPMSLWQSLEALEKYERDIMPQKVRPMLEAFFTGDYHSNHCEVRSRDSGGNDIG
jgi:heme-degrading monooxygenase HmoA